MVRVEKMELKTYYWNNFIIYYRAANWRIFLHIPDWFDYQDIYRFDGGIMVKYHWREKTVRKPVIRLSLVFHH